MNIYVVLERLWEIYFPEQVGNLIEYLKNKPFGDGEIAFKNEAQIIERFEAGGVAITSFVEENEFFLTDLLTFLGQQEKPYQVFLVPQEQEVAELPECTIMLRESKDKIGIVNAYFINALGNYEKREFNLENLKQFNFPENAKSVIEITSDGDTKYLFSQIGLSCGYNTYLSTTIADHFSQKFSDKFKRVIFDKKSIGKVTLGYGYTCNLTGDLNHYNIKQGNAPEHERGWKLHVSINDKNLMNLQAALPIVLKVAFKYQLVRFKIKNLGKVANDERLHASACGKQITVYVGIDDNVPGNMISKLFNFSRELTSELIKNNIEFSIYGENVRYITPYVGYKNDAGVTQERYRHPDDPGYMREGQKDPFQKTFDELPKFFNFIPVCNDTVLEDIIPSKPIITFETTQQTSYPKSKPETKRQHESKRLELKEKEQGRQSKDQPKVPLLALKVPKEEKPEPKEKKRGGQSKGQPERKVPPPLRFHKEETLELKEKKREGQSKDQPERKVPPPLKLHKEETSKEKKREGQLKGQPERKVPPPLKLHKEETLESKEKKHEGQSKGQSERKAERNIYSSSIFKKGDKPAKSSSSTEESKNDEQTKSSSSSL